MAYPSDFKYTKEHEWIKADGKTGTVGITNYAQESLGDIVFVELPKVGTEITAGKAFGSVESVKAVSDLYAPASGTVTEVNTTRIGTSAIGKTRFFTKAMLPRMIWVLVEATSMKAM